MTGQLDVHAHFIVSVIRSEGITEKPLITVQRGRTHLKFKEVPTDSPKQRELVPQLSDLIPEKATQLLFVLP